MGLLSTKARKALPESDFGLPSATPGKGKYPMPNKSHAANAKSRAAQQYDTGNLSMGQKAKIDAKANKMLKGNK